jgi:hypothetical protein
MRAFEIGAMNERQARESGLRLKAWVADGADRSAGDLRKPNFCKFLAISTLTPTRA